MSETIGIRLGISPLTWTNDDMPSLGGEVPLEKCLSEMAEAGFTGTEMGAKYPRDARTLGELLNLYGLRLASGWYSANLLTHNADQEIEAMQNHLALLKALGSDVMVVGEVSNTVHGSIETPLSQRPILSTALWDEFGKKLTACGDYLAGEGVRLAYHHHVGTIIETAEDIDRLMETTGNSVGLTLDTGHLTFGGVEPMTVLKRHIERIPHVHLKDVRRDILQQARRDDWSFLDAVLAGVFTVPGDGCIDFSSIFAHLASAEYCGWLLVEAEQDPGKAEPLKYAKMAYRNVSEYRRHAGL